MDRAERERDATIKALREAHAALDGMSDTDIGHLTEDEEREAAPVQYAARRVMQAIEALTERADGELLQQARQALSDIKRAADTAETPTNRLRFIAARAQAAIEGRPWDARAEGIKSYHIRKRDATAQGKQVDLTQRLRDAGMSSPPGADLDPLPPT